MNGIHGGRPSKTDSQSSQRQFSDPEAVLVPLDDLLPADSPRLLGVDEGHARMLADIETELPPILVQRRSMRVIDGMHRLRAARLNEKTHVAVRFFDGGDAAAFVQAVTANITHGLPLSLADREASAVRIVRLQPHLSDRAVAQATGLSGKTVGALRRRLGDCTQPETRMGRDGRVRPVDASIGRRIASELIVGEPTASLREIARAAGISPATVRDVRDRLRRGEDPVRDGQRRADLPPAEPRRIRSVERPAAEAVDTASVLENLRQDPSLRYTESGRTLLRWLDRRLIRANECDDLIDGIPPHCLPVLTRLARQCVDDWRSLTEMLEQCLRDIA